MATTGDHGNVCSIRTHVLLSRRHDESHGSGSRRQVAVGGALREDAERGDGSRPRRARQGRRRAGQAGAGGHGRRHARDPARDGPPRRRRHGPRRPPRAGEGRRDALRGDARVARGAGAARSSNGAWRVRSAPISARGRRSRSGAGSTRCGGGSVGGEVGRHSCAASTSARATRCRWRSCATLLEDAGYDDVRTYIASGNVLLDGPAGRKTLALGSRAARRRRLRRDDGRDPAQATRARRDASRRTRSASTSDTHVAFLAKRAGQGCGRRGSKPVDADARSRGRRALPPAAARRARIPPLERADRVAARRPGHASQLAHGRRLGRARRGGVGSRRHHDKEGSMALARVVSFEGVDSDRIAQMKSEIEDGEQPEGMHGDGDDDPPRSRERQRSRDRLLRQRGRLRHRATRSSSSMPTSDTPGTSDVGRRSTTSPSG